MKKKARGLDAAAIIDRHQKRINSGPCIIWFLKPREIRRKRREVKERIKARLLDNPYYLINLRAGMR